MDKQLGHENMNYKYMGMEQSSGHLYSKKFLILFGTISGLLSCFVIYGNFLTNPDCMVYGGGLSLLQSGNWERSLGRWMLPVLDWVRGGVAEPYFNAFLCAIGFSSAAVMLQDILGPVKSKSVQLLGVLLTVCTPLLSITITYTYCSAAYGLAFFLSVFAVWIVVNHNGKASVIIGAICLSLSLAIYQSYIGATAAVAVEYLVFQLYRGEIIQKVWKKLCRMLVMGILGVGSYYFIALPAVLNFYQIELASYKGADKISVAQIIRMLPQSVLTTYNDFWKFFGAHEIAANPLWISPVSILFILFGLAVLIFGVCVKCKCCAEKILLVILTCSLPVAAGLIDLLNPSTRIILLTVGGFVTVIPFCFYLINDAVEQIQQCIGKDALKLVVPILAGLLVWNSILSISMDGMYMKQAKNRNIQITNRICYFWEERALSNTDVEQKVLIAGNPLQANYKIQDPTLESKVNQYAKWGDLWQVLENSMIGWSEMFKQYTGMTLNQCSLDKATEIVKSEEFKEMTNYPEEGSIKVIDGVLTIKMSSLEGWTY